MSPGGCTLVTSISDDLNSNARGGDVDIGDERAGYVGRIGKFPKRDDSAKQRISTLP